MDKFLDVSPLALHLLGAAALWVLKASWLLLAVVLVLAWNAFRVLLAMLFFGRLPRSYIRAFD